MQRWEYRVRKNHWSRNGAEIRWPGKFADKDLDRLGGEGWELVSVTEIYGPDFMMTTFYLKRPLAD
jgi:hypothetical protein